MTQSPIMNFNLVLGLFLLKIQSTTQKNTELIQHSNSSKSNFGNSSVFLELNQKHIRSVEYSKNKSDNNPKLKDTSLELNFNAFEMIQINDNYTLDIRNPKEVADTENSTKDDSTAENMLFEIPSHDLDLESMISRKLVKKDYPTTEITAENDYHTNNTLILEYDNQKDLVKENIFNSGETVGDLDDEFHLKPKVSSSTESRVLQSEEIRLEDSLGR